MMSRPALSRRSLLCNAPLALLAGFSMAASHCWRTGWSLRRLACVAFAAACRRAGDKTGTGSNGAVNDVAILWPPARQPILAAVYMSESTAGTEALNAAHAQIGRLIAESLA